MIVSLYSIAVIVSGVSIQMVTIRSVLVRVMIRLMAMQMVVGWEKRMMMPLDGDDNAYEERKRVA